LTATKTSKKENPSSPMKNLRETGLSFIKMVEAAGGGKKRPKNELMVRNDYIYRNRFATTLYQ
jgi:hypothetical protein